MCRSMIRLIGLAVALLFTLPSLTETMLGQVVLTGTNVFDTDHSQYFGSGAWNLYLTSPNAGMDAPFINPATSPSTALNESLAPGSYQFWMYALPNGNDSDWAMNLYFDGDTSPDISVIAPMELSSSAEPSFGPNGSNNTLGLNTPNPVLGANSLKALINGTPVTLTDFSWADPTVYNLDRVGSTTPTPSGITNYVGSFTLNVGSSTSVSTPTGPIGVQFVQAGPKLGLTQTAGVDPQDDFNTVSVNNSTGTSGTTQDLFDSDGAATGITLTHISNDGYNSDTDSSTPNGILLHGEDKSGPDSSQNQGPVPGQTATYTFNNVPTGNYTLVAYVENDSPASASVNANITVGSTTYYVTDEAVAGGTPAFSNASNTNPNVRVTGNYVEFNNVRPVGGEISLTNTSEGGSNDTASINGFQLIPSLATQTTNARAPASLTTPPPTATSLGSLDVYDPKTGTFDYPASTSSTNPGYINPNEPTIVLTHGWRENSDDVTQWPSQMATLMNSAINGHVAGAGTPVNLVAWNWSSVAGTSESLPGLTTALDNVPNEGTELGSQLLGYLGTNYDLPIHYLGHSLGTMVNATAINEFYSQDHAETHVQDTLFDAAEAANYAASLESALIVEPPPTWAPAIPTAPVASIENYVSAFGLLYPNAVNVVLTQGPTAINLIPFHDYPMTWYENTIGTQADQSVMGFRYDITQPNGLTGEPVAGTDPYNFVQTAQDSGLQLNPILPLNGDSSFDVANKEYGNTLVRLAGTSVVTGASNLRAMLVSDVTGAINATTNAIVNIRARRSVRSTDLCRSDWNDTLNVAASVRSVCAERGAGTNSCSVWASSACDLFRP